MKEEEKKRVSEVSKRFQFDLGFGAKPHWLCALLARTSDGKLFWCPYFRSPLQQRPILGSSS
jgi:hypothetical protein